MQPSWATEGRAGRNVRWGEALQELGEDMAERGNWPQLDGAYGVCCKCHGMLFSGDGGSRLAKSKQPNKKRIPSLVGDRHPRINEC
ncbi:unnamed protein product [Urochloa humidicola]